ncbi:DUF6980 family protein [Streptomyces sp. NPDC058758]|uniref:DUF6980 family protein n=1 Tax=Streptomyces sp. NPDC058758 TaxID=3346627 RepID=UPI003678FAB1
MPCARRRVGVSGRARRPRSQLPGARLVVQGGGRPGAGTAHRPWRGGRLPASQRDRWCEETERLGPDPWEDDVPSAHEDGCRGAGTGAGSRA